MTSESPFSSYFDTNGPPSALDADGIAALIADRGEAASEIRARLERLAKEAQGLQGQLDEHTQYIDEHKAIISSFRRLTDDTLIRIFLAGSGHFRFSPIAISHVSRRWRKLALDTPLMWTTVRAHIRERRTAPAKAVSQARLERVSAYIERSASLGLSIEVTADPINSSSLQEWLGVHEDLAVILEPTSSRWEQLHVNVPTDSPLIRLLRIPATGVAALHTLSTNFENLFRKLAPETPEAPSTVNPTISVWTAESLTTLSLFGIGKSIIETNVTLPVQWSALTSLHLSSGSQGHLRQHHVTPILSACSNLVKCSLTFYSDNTESPVTQIAAEATLPNLRSLELHGAEVEARGLASKLTLPSLTGLTTLFTMATDAAREGESALVEWVDRFGDQLLNVSFDYVTITQSALTHCLSRLPNVVRLKMTGKSSSTVFNMTPPGHSLGPHSALIDDDILESLTPRFSNDHSELNGKGLCLCPQLQRLECHMGFVERSEAAFVQLILARYGDGKKQVLQGGVRRIEEVVLTFNYEKCDKEGSPDIVDEVNKAVDVGPLAINVRYHAPLALEAAQSLFQHLVFRREK